MATQSVLIDKSAPLVPSLNSRRIAILGFGTVGKSVARILSERKLADLQLSQVFNRNVERKRVPWVSRNVRWTENIADVLASDSDFVVEVIGGVEPAKQWVKAILESGRSVVTANKALLSAHGKRRSVAIRIRARRMCTCARAARGPSKPS